MSAITRLGGVSLGSSTTTVSSPALAYVQLRAVSRSRTREKKRIKKRLGYTTFSKTGETTFIKGEGNKKQRQKKQEAEEDGKVLKIPEGNAKQQQGVNFNNPTALRQGLQDMLNAPVQQPLGRKKDLKTSDQLGIKKKVYENDKKTEKKEPKKRDDDEDDNNPLTEEQEAEMKKMVFSDRKDYIKYQIHVLKEKVKHEEKISAHR